MTFYTASRQTKERMNIASSLQCTVCGTSEINVFVEITQVPIHCNVLWPTKREALSAPRGDLRIGYCKKCGHVFNTAFDPALMEYTQAYENSLHFSPSFQRFAEELVDGLIERYGLRSKDIVDIGCGKGDFLKLICARGKNRGWGFDPSYVPEKKETASSVTFIQEFYSEKHTNYAADLVACRHVLEHIQFPREFVANVRRSVGNRFKTAVYFEVPNILYTLRDMGIWDMIYEHCSYFSSPSISRVFSSSGFDVTDVRETFGGQYLSIEAHATASPVGSMPDNSVDYISGLVEGFATSNQQKTAFWKDQLSSFTNSSRRVVVWGGGSKGVTFLNVFRNHKAIEFMVDINPRKQGMHIAGTGQKIVGPEFLKEYHPDNVIIMNPLYQKEIEQSLAALGLNAQVLVG